MIPTGEVKLQDYMVMLERRWRVIALLAITGTALGFLIAHVLPKKFTSQTVVLVDQQRVPEGIVKSVVTEDLNHRLASMKEQILSRSGLEPILDKFSLYPKDAQRVPKEDLIDRFRKSITVSPMEAMQGTEDRRLPGFYISVTLDKAATAQQVCQEITTMFMQQNLQRREQQATDTTAFLSQQLDEAKQKLDEHDAKLADFKRRYLGALPDEEQTNLSLLTGLNTQLEATTQSLNRAQQDKAFADSLLTQQQMVVSSSQSGPNAQTLEQQLSAMQEQLVALQARYTDEHPDVIKAKRNIEHAKQQLAAASQNTAEVPKTTTASAADTPQIQQLRAQLHQDDVTIQGLAKRQEQLQQQIRGIQGRVQSSPLVEQQFKELTRNYQVALESYNDLLKKRDQAQISTELEHRQQGEQFRVLDPPDLPSRPSFPDWRLFSVGGLVGGLLLGIGLAMLLEAQDKSLRTEREVEIFLKSPALAMIPTFDGIGDTDVHSRGTTTSPLTGGLAKA